MNHTRAILVLGGVWGWTLSLIWYPELTMKVTVAAMAIILTGLMYVVIATDPNK